MAITDLNEMLMQPSPLGEYFVAARGITGPASYTTGGVLISATRFGLLTKLALVIPETLSASGTYFVKILRTGTGTNVNTVLVQWFVQSTGAQVANGTSLSAESVRIMVIGN